MLNENAQYPSIAEVSEVDIAYAAGLLEGEANFVARMNGTTALLAVRVGMTDLEPLARLKELFGGTVKGPIFPHNPAYKPHYKWHLGRSHDCMLLVARIYPYMSPRRRAIIDRMFELDSTTVTRKYVRDRYHGTISGYFRIGCRCSECKSIGSLWLKAKRGAKHVES